MLTLKEGAFFVADAHENEDRRGFWNFLQALEKGEICTPQLFLMGDIFDLLVGEISASHTFAKPYIASLENLCEKMEVYYLEGNHDFNLSCFFQKVRVIPLQNQPLILHTSKGKKEKFFLAHGDIFLNPFLQFLLKSLRNRFLLCFLNVLNFLTFSSISKQILARQKRKNLFYKIENFKILAYKRYEKYQAKGAWVIEGHYHQNLFLKEERVKYFNLPSFAYERSFFVVKFAPEVKFEKQQLRGQNV
ncbi:UDP-2,3-diacylglucosamine diphosphatase [Campylobacter vulpis]|uniref:UDP-2,3-diacylglucosamine hydrolase n=1 Tax=Campylobacter vulpis TaxID=1655500 RepID=A0A2G4R0C4_9BACT|nr:metallophosphoesterase [Campylobacter vulpis]MBS4234910.1 UDP-2,3-diacylglucosamine diphosphatase [Campylobacter vulpis]MBS4268520.1 UDP-2,3-diacylglucosamine diphosphatase [Campylobacter vulpis]MBS4330760.1 UDP-2,3-diacylglucosamine diphosphatase [Campylobacter vulpis]MBS4406263.1 UDP-2,3-diacylglucosamine diphosphatase [Campylobacter vulpis]MBS4438937.1 UDP-2,3-diacylglucosamine diphosphatase [Campylobacter vulpis]